MNYSLLKQQSLPKYRDFLLLRRRRHQSLNDQIFLGTKYDITRSCTKSNRRWTFGSDGSCSRSSSEYVRFFVFCFDEFFELFSFSDDRRDPDEREDKGDDDLKPLTREELKQRALEQVKNLERKALQEQNKYSDPTPATAREKSSTGASRAAPGETSKAGTARPR